MIGQESLISRINSYTIDTLPHSILLLGDRGSGHREICESISSNFSLDLFDLTKAENFKEFIDTIYGNPTPTLYIIDLFEFNDPKDLKQNALLKLFEEPSSYCYIIIIGEDDSHLIETIKNRSYLIEMNRYTKDQLRPLVSGDVDLTLSLCNTPGQVEVANHNDLIMLDKLCNSILDNMCKASFPNTLSIANKVNFKDEYNKFDLFLFIKCLGKCLRDRLSENTLLYTEMYNNLKNMNKKIWLVSNKKQQFENFLIKMWKSSRDSSLQKLTNEV